MYSKKGLKKVKKYRKSKNKSKKFPIFRLYKKKFIKYKLMTFDNNNIRRNICK